MNTQPEKDSASPTIEPKKSARLAQKRKLREESGTPLSEDDFCFSQFSYGKGALGFSPIKSGVSPTSPKLNDQSLSPLSKSLKSISPPSPRVLVKPTPKSSIRPNSRPTLSSLASRTSASISPTQSSGGSTLSSTFGTLKTFSAGSNFASVPKKISEISQKQKIENDRKWFAAFDTKRLDDYPKEIIRSSSTTTQSQICGLGKKVADSPILRQSHANTLFDDLSMKLEAEVLQEQKLADRAKEIVVKLDAGKAVNEIKVAQNQHSDQGKGLSLERKTCSGIIILSRVEGNTITFPEGMDIPIRKTVHPPKPAVLVKCHIENCTNQKKYSCSRTGVPLCSLACYKTNLAKQTGGCNNEVPVGEKNIKIEVNEDW